MEKKTWADPVVVEVSEVSSAASMGSKPQSLILSFAYKVDKANLGVRHEVLTKFRRDSG